MGIDYPARVYDNLTDCEVCEIFFHMNMELIQMIFTFDIASGTE